jgi:hypothetical protein
MKRIDLHSHVLAQQGEDVCYRIGINLFGGEL